MALLARLLSKTDCAFRGVATRAPLSWQAENRIRQACEQSGTTWEVPQKLAPLDSHKASFASSIRAAD